MGNGYSLNDQAKYTLRIYTGDKEYPISGEIGDALITRDTWNYYPESEIKSTLTDFFQRFLRMRDPNVTYNVQVIKRYEEDGFMVDEKGLVIKPVNLTKITVEVIKENVKENLNFEEFLVTVRGTYITQEQYDKMNADLESFVNILKKDFKIIFSNRVIDVASVEYF